MLDSRPTSPDEIPDLEKLLRSQKLCFNDINSEGVQLFSVLEQDKLIGYYGYELYGKDALFRSLVVLEGLRHKGYGTRCVHLAEKQMKHAGVKKMYLLTNTAANFFESLGFDSVDRQAVPSEISETSEFKTFCPDDSICFTKTITTSS